MEYVKHKPENPSFKQDGFDGYNYLIENENVSITFEDVYKGHERYCTNKKCTHIYFVISGKGIFKINDEIFEVTNGDVIEIPKDNKFIFAGEMKLLLVMNPKFSKDDEIVGKLNDLY